MVLVRDMRQQDGVRVAPDADNLRRYLTAEQLDLVLNESTN
jgi:hypothetical protein